MSAAQERLAGYIATLGRGPGRARSLTRAEAADAMQLLLRGGAHPAQTGALLMLLRYRGEDPAEIAGLAEAARACIPPIAVSPALDWPSYGAGKTRGAPWFLLAALALAQAGHSVLMHGTNDFSAGQSVAQGLAALGRAPCADAAAVAASLAGTGFAYWPIAAMLPAYADLLGLRRLLGLRSPLNTAARLLNPGRAESGVNGVFHPPYIDTHCAAALLLGQPRSLVLKGGGGEAERNPAKPAAVHLAGTAIARREDLLPALTTAPHPAPEPDFAAIWRGAARDAAIEARITGTIALGLMALGRGGDAEAQILWENRRAIT